MNCGYRDSISAPKRSEADILLVLVLPANSFGINTTVWCYAHLFTHKYLCGCLISLNCIHQHHWGLRIYRWWAVVVLADSLFGDTWRSWPCVYSRSACSQDVDLSEHLATGTDVLRVSNALYELLANIARPEWNGYWWRQWVAVL